jgi:hypothetical protein
MSKTIDLAARRLRVPGARESEGYYLRNGDLVMPPMNFHAIITIFSCERVAKMSCCGLRELIGNDGAA